MVLPIPLEQMRAQIDSADIKPLNPNELAHLSEEEVRRYLASRAGKPTAAQNYQALNERFITEHAGFRLVSQSYSGQASPSSFVERASPPMRR